MAGGGGGGRLYASYFTTATEESVHKVVENVLALVFRSAMREVSLIPCFRVKGGKGADAVFGCHTRLGCCRWWEEDALCGRSLLLRMFREV